MPSTQREQLSEINAKVTETAERVKMLNDWHNEVNEWRKQVDLSLATIKTNLAAGLPAMFGFTVYSSIEGAGQDGKIPFPEDGEKVLGGHAIMAVGYDDRMKIRNPAANGVKTTGALLIRNSWGAAWGDKGYGWLPYEYVLTGLAIDWWSLLKNEWVDTGEFKIPEEAGK